MTFRVFADGTANLPEQLREGIELLPSDYTVDGVEKTYVGDIDQFDVHAYYEGLRNGMEVHTSLLNTELFLSHFTPLLKQGMDIIYVAMSSGISGTYNAARIAAQELMEQNPGRFVHIVDSRGCGFGNGMLAIKAAQLSRDGVDVRTAAKILDDEVDHCCQYFTVDDINFLRKTGRVGGAAAVIATTLNIKPILYGDATGHIVSCSISRGRRKAIEALAKKYSEKRVEPADPNVYISHGDCLGDAQKLADMVKAVTPEVTVHICAHEPFSGAHVGPGMLAVFFRGKER